MLRLKVPESGNLRNPGPIELHISFADKRPEMRLAKAFTKPLAKHKGPKRFFVIAYESVTFGRNAIFPACARFQSNVNTVKIKRK